MIKQVLTLFALSAHKPVFSRLASIKIVVQIYLAALPGSIIIEQEIALININAMG